MIIKVMGGLGNQMFQYALYKKLLVIGMDVSLDDRSIIRDGNQHNGLELERAFGLKYKKMDKSAKNMYNLWRIKCLIKNKLGIEFEDDYCLKDDHQIPFESIKEGGYKYLLGYWQDPSYFIDIRNILLSDFQFQIHSKDIMTLKIEEKIRESEAVSVHIRRGDYLLQKDWSGVCTKEYYEKGIEYIKNKIENTRLYFFSDDPDWVKENFKKYEYTLIDWNLGENSFHDMYLMSICKHNIIANSTFSWWGAWLNINEKKIVVCPSKWFPNIDMDPAMDKWVKISKKGELIKI